jgi:PEGA domain
MPSLEFLKSSPQTEALRIESQPSGAEAKAASGQSCRTPCELNIQGGGETITLALNGYQPQTVSVQPEASSGMLSSITGSTRLAPNPVQVELQPAPAPKKMASKKKKSTTAARPAASSVASAAPPAAPAAPAPEAPAEAAASATNYPWPSR